VRRTTLQRHEKRQKQERRLLVAVDFAAPLEGVTVLEVGAFMAAPFATMQLADLGARVLKIENPIGGDPVRATGPFLDGESSPFVRLNRNKESASGWGQDGPLASLPGLDIMAQARGGLMSITGTPDGDPVKIGVPICDLVCALYVALGVTAALKERDRSGVGQYLDVSLLESGVSFAIWEAGKYFATGEVGHPLGSAHQSTAPYQALRSADGYITAGAVTDKTWAAFCAALGLEHIRDDERYATGSIRHGHRDTLIPAIEAVTSTRTTADLIATLDAAGVPCAPIADYGQVFTDDHLNQRGYFWDAPHPALGPIRQLGSPMRLSRTPARQDCAGPQLGNSTRAALEWAEIPSAEVTALLDSGVAADPAHPSAALPEVPAPSADDRPI
jgi:crotonobetainyl-CoA:carnitine CoA-transferase CaiB-like acyl-CoA transferase